MAQLATAAVLTLGPPVAGSEQPRLPHFELDDQFGRAHNGDDVRGRVVVVIGSDRDGSPYNGEWGRSIRQAIATEPASHRVEFLRVADLKGVPGVLKGRVKGRLRKQVEGSVLLDWEGRFAEDYGFEPASSNILIIDRDGALVYQTHGREPAGAEIQVITEIVKELLRQGAQELSSP